MTRRAPAPFLASAIAAAVLLAPGAAAPAQEINDAGAALSINGTGRVDASGTPRVSNAMGAVIPGAAPAHPHRAQERTALELRVQGSAAGAPFVIAFGTVVPTGLCLGAVAGSTCLGERLEIDLAGLGLLVNGLQPANPIDATATLSATGTWTFVLSQGLAESFPVIGFQAATIDAAAPFGFRLSGTVSLDVRDDLETLTRNFLDSLVEGPINPLYMLSLATGDFRWDGYDAFGFLASIVMEDELTDFVFEGIGPNTTTAPALPPGGPAAGQPDQLYRADFALTFPGECASLGAGGERGRVYDLTAVEVAGAWKLAGNRRDAEVTAELRFAAGPAAAPANGLTATLVLDVEESLGRNGGIAAVVVSGPQLAAVSGGVALNDACGSLPLQYFGPAGEGSAFGAEILLGQVGTTSRLPWVEDLDGVCPASATVCGITGCGVRDVYDVTIYWTDLSPPSGPYSIPLRAAIEVDVNPAGALVALPGAAATPTATLSGAGGQSAVFSLTFHAGALPTGTDGDLDVSIVQGGSEWEFDEVAAPADGALRTLSFCTPGMAGGPVTVELERADVFGTEYFHTVMVSMVTLVP